jgi:uncharacterized protein (DUF3820 family)
MTPFSSEQQLAYEQQQELPTITFGKYEGRTVHDNFQIDPQYLAWLLQQDWFRVKFGSSTRLCECSTRSVTSRRRTITTNKFSRI